MENSAEYSEMFWRFIKTFQDQVYLNKEKRFFDFEIYFSSRFDPMEVEMFNNLNSSC